ncbi:MAG: PAS domain S-box protein [Methanobacteriaceae archaeon]|jgi:PAS domain S-box-containing protein|nr:PAS domain S-box protein [Methanobacteriaceae archaeon]
MSGDKKRTLENLILELNEMKQRISELEKSEKQHEKREKSLTESIERYSGLEHIINHTPVIVFLWRASEGWPVEFVTRNIVQFGYSPEDFYSGRVPYADIIHPDDLSRIAGEVDYYSREEERQSFRQGYRIITKDGTVRWTDDRTWIRRNEKGEITHYQGIVLDITETKDAEKALKESETRYSTIFEHTGTAMAIIGEDKILSLVNSEFEKLSALSKDEIENKKRWTDMVYKDDLERMREYHSIRRDNPELAPEHYEFRFVDAKNNIKTVLATVAVFPETKMSLASLLDISDRKKTEERILESEERTRRLLRESFDAWVIHAGGMIMDGNSAAMEVMGGKIEDFRGKSLIEFVHPDFREAVAKRTMRMYTEGGTVPLMEEKWLKLDATPIDVEVVATSFKYKGNPAVQVVFRDITQRKMAEEALKKSVKEKEMLVKEIHHRVKNNLMVISSLLNLQSTFIKDKEVLDIFRESQNRAKSMALIHERLYGSTDLKRIDFGDYIRSLATDLYHTYVANPAIVTLNFNVDSLMLDINTTVPLGLIVNELVSNCVKHAFPPGKKGEINIDFHEIDDEYVLKVCDTGVGFSEDIDFRNTESLGLQLVNNLVGQIDGNIELDRSHGTGFTIKFKELEL